MAGSASLMGASEVLAVALRQVDGILARSSNRETPQPDDHQSAVIDGGTHAHLRAAEPGQQVTTKVTTKVTTSTRVTSLLTQLKSSIQGSEGSMVMMVEEEEDNVKQSVSRDLLDFFRRWLLSPDVDVLSASGGYLPDTVEEKVRKLEAEKQSLTLQVNVLTEQLEAQSEKIADLEQNLADRDSRLAQAQDSLQAELMTRTSLESRKLDLMNEVASLSVKVTDLHTHIRDLEQRYRAAQRQLAEQDAKLLIRDAELAELRHRVRRDGALSLTDPGDTDVERLRRAVDTLMFSNDDKDRRIEELRRLVKRYRRVEDILLQTQGRTVEELLQGAEEDNSNSSSTCSTSLPSPHHTPGRDISQIADFHRNGLFSPSPTYNSTSGHSVDGRREISSTNDDSGAARTSAGSSQHPRGRSNSCDDMPFTSDMISSSSSSPQDDPTATGEGKKRTTTTTTTTATMMAMTMTTLSTAALQKDGRRRRYGMLALPSSGSFSSGTTTSTLKQQQQQQADSGGDGAFYYRPIARSVSMHSSPTSSSSSPNSSAFASAAAAAASSSSSSSSNNPHHYHHHHHRHRRSGLQALTRAFFRLRSSGNKHSQSAPNLVGEPGDVTRDAGDGLQEKEGGGGKGGGGGGDKDAKQQQQQQQQDPKKTRRLKQLFSKLKRSSSQNFEGGRDRVKGREFQRGGFRATTSARLADWSPRSLRAEREEGFAGWDGERVAGWLMDQDLTMYLAECRRWVTTGQQLLDASPHDLEKELGMKNALHRKKLHLALQAQISGEDDTQLADVDHNVVARWLDDIGLPQYKDAFYDARVDGRMLHHLTVDDLLALKVSNELHHLSIKRGIQVLRLCGFDLTAFHRRPLPQETQHPVEDGPGQVMLWTSHRVMEWLRTIDLSEYAPNLRGSGVHGALMVLEPRFNAELLAVLLSIPAHKTLLRRHLCTHFVSLIGPQTQARKRQFESSPDYQPIVLNAKVRRSKSGLFGHRRSRSEAGEVDRLICPVEPDRTQQQRQQQTQEDTKSSQQTGAVSKDMSNTTVTCEDGSEEFPKVFD
ncbi:liprin-beta-2-like isoform X2 [Babylonia areolata]|uniref:liprin-beta-2-like isoform X2 n=1 Tax=Babylonia areolata TaxID=304850 RepID=UPI003FD48D96